MIVTGTTRRPRNVDSPRAAAILYGDWGTSKAYVIGLAFAVGGYGSFWLIAAMCVLTALVGVNYMVICRHYPDGGGVYASVRHRSEIISIVGAFLLIADYIVTAAISALSAFDYLKLPHPEIFAAVSIAAIGALNTLGPRHTGGLAFLVSVPTAVVVILLALFSLPHLSTAVHNVQPLTGGFAKNWKGFVGVVLALSGVEAIANSTGVMKLNPGSTDANPDVSKTSTPAILWVMLEVCIFTALLITRLGSACMASLSKAVKMQTSSMTHKMAGVDVLETLGLASVVPGLSFITPVELAIASTPDKARTTPTNPFQLCQKPPCSGSRLCNARPRCGMEKIANPTTTTAVGAAIKKARPPVWRGPK